MYTCNTYDILLKIRLLFTRLLMYYFDLDSLEVALVFISNNAEFYVSDIHIYKSWI